MIYYNIQMVQADSVIANLKEGNIVYFPDAQTAVKQVLLYDVIFFSASILSYCFCSWLAHAFYFIVSSLDLFTLVVWR